MTATAADFETMDGPTFTWLAIRYQVSGTQQPDGMPGDRVGKSVELNEDGRRRPVWPASATGNLMAARHSEDSLRTIP
jgi:hypothetical protein